MEILLISFPKKVRPWKRNNRENSERFEVWRWKNILVLDLL